MSIPLPPLVSPLDVTDIQNILDNLVASVGQAINDAFNAYQSTIISNVSSVITAAIGGAITTLTNVIDGVVTAVNASLGTLTSLINTIISSISTLVTTAINDILAIINTIVGYIQQLLNTVEKELNSLQNILYGGIAVVAVGTVALVVGLLYWKSVEVADKRSAMMQYNRNNPQIYDLDNGVEMSPW